MESINIPKDIKLVAIVGETGSGKSALAMELAQKYRGEIVAADSRTVYKGMDIGTAKPTKADQKLVPHHLLDVVKPDETFNVADFKHLANETIENINNRDKVAFLVGGTGLYVDAVLYDYQFGPPADPSLREKLQALSVPELQAIITKKGLKMPENAQNPRHLIRSIEINGQESQIQPLRAHSLVLGVHLGTETLKLRSAARTDAMIKAGLVEESRGLAKRYGWDAEPLRAPAYKAMRQYLEGIITLEQAKEQIIQADMNLAKRQRTWFKRNSDIHWL